MKVTFGGKKKKVAAMPPQTLINYFSSAPSPRSAPVHGSNERGEGSVVSQNSRRPQPCVCSCIKASQCAFQSCVTQGILCLSFRLPANEEKLLSQQRWCGGGDTRDTKGGNKTTKELAFNHTASLFLTNPIKHGSEARIGGKTVPDAVLQ